MRKSQAIPSSPPKSRMSDGSIAILMTSLQNINRSVYFYFVRPYGDRFIGFKLMPSFFAFDLTLLSVRPSLRPMTRVGVFSFASFWRCFTSSFDQFLP
jgi:hypothetical protein